MKLAPLLINIWIEWSREFCIQVQTQEFIFEKYGNCTGGPAGPCISLIFSFAIWFSAQSSVAKSSENTQVNNVEHCRWSINLLSRDFVDSTREVGAIATSQAVKKRSLCPADKSQFSLYPFASLHCVEQKLGRYIPNIAVNQNKIMHSNSE